MSRHEGQDRHRWDEGERPEGVYVKTYDRDVVTGRFKMVRPDFVPGALWDPEKLTRNSLAKKDGTR
jgi:hypothetical protein